MDWLKSIPQVMSPLEIGALIFCALVVVVAVLYIPIQDAMRSKRAKQYLHFVARMHAIVSKHSYSRP